MYTGMALTGLGSAALVGGVTVVAVSLGHDDCGPEGECTMNAAMTTVFLGFPLIGGSVLLAGVGVPLWVLGARAPTDEAAEQGARSAIPTVTIGAGSAALSWKL